MLAAIFPSIQGSPELDELVEAYPEALKSLFGISGTGSLTTGAGYMDIEFFSLILPLLLLVLAIGSGARQIAGDEDTGRLELMLAYPVPRRGAVLAKALVVAAETALVAGAATLALAVLTPIADLGLSYGRLLAATAGIAGVALLHGWLALALGAAGAGRAVAIAVPGALATAAYLVNGLHELAGWLDPFRFLSSFWLIGGSLLQNGPNSWGLLAVAAAAGATLAAGVLLFERRDLRVP
jgi:ABC-2 type transport system permease protein